MKNVKDLLYGSPSKFLKNFKDENQKRIAFAQEAISEIEDFLEQYKRYLAVLEKVQTVLDSEKIE